MKRLVTIVFGLALTGATAVAEPLVAGDPEAGAKIAASCVACHGPKGNSSNPQWPKLADQHATYLVRQLALFKSGKRASAIMQPQAARLSEQEMRDVAAFYSLQAITPGVASEDLVERGARLYRLGDPEAGIPPCAGCHGPAGRGNAAAGYPRIAGQHAVYVAAELKAFRAATRNGYPLAETMAAVAKNLTDAHIKALASYVQGLSPRGQR